MKDGGAIVTAGSEMYAIKGGGNNTFYKYTPATGEARQLVLDTIPRLHKKSVPKTGAELTYANGYIYLIKGNNTPEFWRYGPLSNVAVAEI
ncbi:MAG: hypothetical protein N2748_02720, partial [candidate division WOR-3 bacterium]|nr:hypothetical protein [candidate division WOR-3 bacterium]